MGLFDKKAHKEEPEIRKKRKNTPTYFGSAKDENKRDMGKIFLFYTLMNFRRFRTSYEKPRFSKSQSIKRKKNS